jgi:excisionase family DNA binding protein
MAVWLVVRRKDGPLDHTVVLGLIAAWLYEGSGVIVPAIALHAAWNTATTLTLAGTYAASSAASVGVTSPPCHWQLPFGHRGQKWARRNEKGKDDYRGGETRHFSRQPINLRGEPMADTAVALGDALLSPQQLADYLGVPVATVYRWRYESTGPRGIKVGKHVRYRRRDVEAWLEERTDPDQ